MLVSIYPNLGPGNKFRTPSLLHLTKKRYINSITQKSDSELSCFKYMWRQLCYQRFWSESVVRRKAWIFFSLYCICSCLWSLQWISFVAIVYSLWMLTISSDGKCQSFFYESQQMNKINAQYCATLLKYRQVYQPYKKNQFKSPCNALYNHFWLPSNISLVFFAWSTSNCRVKARKR